MRNYTFHMQLSDGRVLTWRNLTKTQANNMHKWTAERLGSIDDGVYVQACGWSEDQRTGELT